MRGEMGVLPAVRPVVLTKKCTIKIDAHTSYTCYATGWRATGKMVITYIHTCSTNQEGGVRKKEKEQLLTDGSVRVIRYQVQRPKVGSEYQAMMGAIDMHNYFRQARSSVSVLPFEVVCVTNDSTHRIVINIVGLGFVQIYITLYTWDAARCPRGKKTRREVQNDTAMALVNNQYVLEELEQEMQQTEGAASQRTKDEHLQQHPNKNWNLCKQCFTHRSMYYCTMCSNPGKVKRRKDKGGKDRQGGRKRSRPGYNHFCKRGNCFDLHKCDAVQKRRRKVPAAGS